MSGSARRNGRLLAVVAGLAALPILGLTTWLLWPYLDRDGSHPSEIGDGRNVESYGFDLDSLLVPREPLVASGFARDGLPSLDNPQVMTPTEVTSILEVCQSSFSMDCVQTLPNLRRVPKKRAGHRRQTFLLQRELLM